MSPDVDGPTSMARWATAWLGVAGIGILNGAIHRLYTGALGNVRAHQLSGLTFAMLSAPYVVAVDRHWPTRTTREAKRIGVAWSAGAVAFDTVVGHYLAGESWSTVLQAYDLFQGGIWGLVVAVIGAGPCAARYRRLRYARP